MNSVSHSAALYVGGDHPSLPGHFPGHPIVPAVIILERVADELKSWRGMRVARVVEAKFVAPLLPNQRAELTLSESGTSRFRFVVTLDDQALVRGLIEGVA
jgi:3-hydroxymyristoyl/3-hydroxydecanoyl-(acyl carrier protein) dehydratase